MVDYEQYGANCGMSFDSFIDWKNLLSLEDVTAFNDEEIDFLPQTNAALSPYEQKVESYLLYRETTDTDTCYLKASDIFLLEYRDGVAINSKCQSLSYEEFKEEADKPVGLDSVETEILLKASYDSFVSVSKVSCERYNAQVIEVGIKHWLPFLAAVGLIKYGYNKSGYAAIGVGVLMLGISQLSFNGRPRTILERLSFDLLKSPKRISGGQLAEPLEA